AVIQPFEGVQPEPAEPAQGAPEGALPAAAEDPALHTGAQADAPAATGAPPPPPAQPVTVARIVAVDLARARSDEETCRAPDGSPVHLHGRAVRCPHAPARPEPPVAAAAA